GPGRAGARRGRAAALLPGALATPLPSSALVRPGPSAQFGALVVPASALTVDPSPVGSEALSAADPIGLGWRRFQERYGTAWQIAVDARSGVPLLVRGRGIPWIPGSG